MCHGTRNLLLHLENMQKCTAFLHFNMLSNRSTSINIYKYTQVLLQTFQMTKDKVKEELHVITVHCICLYKVNENYCVHHVRCHHPLVKNKLSTRPFLTLGLVILLDLHKN